MKIFLSFVIAILVSCSSDNDQVLQYENDAILRKDVNNFIRNLDVKFDEVVNTNIKNIFSEYKLYESVLAERIDTERLLKAQERLAIKNYVANMKFNEKIQDESYLRDYYDKNTQLYVVNHLHLNLDTLTKKLNRYDIDQSFIDKLIADVEENPDLITSYILKYGAVPKINTRFGLKYQTFEYSVRNMIFNKSDFDLLKFNSQYGSHIVRKLQKLSDEKYEFKSFDEFKTHTDSVNATNLRNEYKAYLVDLFNKKRTDYNYTLYEQNIGQGLLNFNGLEQLDVDKFNYEDQILASLMIEGERYQITMQDLHYVYIDNFFRKLSGIQEKPYLMKLYIQNIADALIIEHDPEFESLKRDYSKIQSKLKFIEMSRRYFSEMLNNVVISEDQLRQEYEQNKAIYVKPHSRMTYGFSVGGTDSARLANDLPKITSRNMITYYKKYNKYLSKLKKVDMRFLGDLQKNSFGKVSEEVFNLEPYEVSKLIKYKNLFYVFYYTTEKDIVQKSFEESRYKIKMNLVNAHKKERNSELNDQFEGIKNKMITQL